MKNLSQNSPTGQQNRTESTPSLLESALPDLSDSCGGTIARNRSSPKRQAWRERIILSRARRPVSNREAFLRASLPKFLEEEPHEIKQYVVEQLVLHVLKSHPPGSKWVEFCRRLSEQDDLDLDDAAIEQVIAVAFFKAKSIDRERFLTRGSEQAGQPAG